MKGQLVEISELLEPHTRLADAGLRKLVHVALIKETARTGLVT